MANRKQREKGRTYCQPSLRGQPKLTKTNPNYCPECDFRIRSTVEAHNAGESHKRIVERRKRVMQIGTNVSIYK